MFSAVNHGSLQEDLGHIQNWTATWHMSFNIDICSVIHFGKSNPGLKYTMFNPAVNNIQEVQSVDEEGDFGIIVDNQCNINSNYKKTVSQPNSVLALLKKAISSRSPCVFVRLALVRSVLDFRMCIASPRYRCDVELLEGVQKRATKAVSQMQDKLYDERLKELKLSTLVYQRKTADVLVTNKITSQKKKQFICQFPKILALTGGLQQLKRY